MAEKKKAVKNYKHPLLHSIGRIIGSILLMFFIIAFIGIAVIIFKYGDDISDCYKTAKNYCDSSSRDTFKSSLTSLVYASDGQLISSLSGDKDVYYLNYADIPQYAIEAMISSEDRKFYEHGGYDIKAIFRAFRALIINEGEVHQGASTITQQLARLVFLNNKVSVRRKVTEIFLATDLEKKYSKNDILEFYMNNIYFANGHYGIQSAAQAYFSKSAAKLSLSQIAFLCAIPNSPTRYDPLKNYDATLERRDKILYQMFETGCISNEDYNSALSETINLVTSDTEKQNYAESYAYYCAVRALMQQQGFVFRNEFIGDSDKQQYEDEYDDLYAAVQKTLFTGGYRIYTSIDLTKQAEILESVESNLSGFTEKKDDGSYALQGAAVCIDNTTGLVCAIAGGRDEDMEGYTLNRAFQSTRQPGSSIKPLVVYTPWFERGMLPTDSVLDKKTEDGPDNSGDVYSGWITVRYAVEMSKNTVAFNLFKELTPQVGLSYLLNMEFSGIVDTDYVAAAGIGGLTYGVTPVEMASAYAAIENDGVYRRPTCIIEITDSDGKAIVKNSAVESAYPIYDGLDGDNNDIFYSKQVYETNAARMMTDTMTYVMTDGTGRKHNLENQITAGKTGTTKNQKDGWFVGYTRYYTTAVWVGYDMPRAMDDLAGNTYPEIIWQDFMTKIHIGLPSLEFEPYEKESSSKGSASSNTGKEITTAAQEITTTAATSGEVPGTTSTTAENGGKVTSLPQETTVAEELLTTAAEDPETVYTTTVQAGDASEDESDNGDGTGSDDDGWQGDMPEYQDEVNNP